MSIACFYQPNKMGNCFQTIDILFELNLTSKNKVVGNSECFVCDW